MSDHTVSFWNKFRRDKNGSQKLSKTDSLCFGALNTSDWPKTQVKAKWRKLRPEYPMHPTILGLGLGLGLGLV